MHATNWGKVQHKCKTIVGFIYHELGLTLNEYLRCPVEYNQYHKDGNFIQPSPSIFPKIKEQKQVTDSFCTVLWDI